MIKLFKEKWSFLFKFRLFLGLIFLITIFVLFFLKVVPFGRITYYRNQASNYSMGKGFIHKFTPVDRVEERDKGAPRIIGDPVYFSVFTPRTFDKVKITLIYKNNLKIDTPIIEVGVLADKTIWQYDLKPLSNKSLDYLSILWNKIEEDGKILLQREKNYPSLVEFEEDLKLGKIKGCLTATANCLAVYNYNPEYSYRLFNHERSLPITIDKTLRGPHQFYVYINNEPLYLNFTFIDLKQNSKSSPIEVILSSREEIIARHIVSEENLSPGRASSTEKELSFEKKNLPAGFYKVEIKTSDDVLIKKIYSSVGKLSFINKIWPAFNNSDNNKNEELNFYTDSPYLHVKVMSPASLQTIKFAGKEFPLLEAYRQLDLQNEAGGTVKKISLMKDEIILENNGVFSLTPDSLFNPSLIKVDRFFSVHTAPPYIIANYQKPSEIEGQTTATAELKLKGVYRENGKYSFMISVPGLKAEDDINDSLEIYSIKMEFVGRTLWQKISQQLFTVE